MAELDDHTITVDEEGLPTDADPRGDILRPKAGHGKAGETAVSGTGTGLNRQWKTPRDLRDKTFIVTDEDK